MSVAPLRSPVPSALPPDQEGDPPPFWRRLGTTTILLAAAVGAHLWLVRAPEAPPASTASLAPAPAVAAPALSMSPPAARRPSGPSGLMPLGESSPATVPTSAAGTQRAPRAVAFEPDGRTRPHVIAHARQPEPSRGPATRAAGGGSIGTSGTVPASSPSSASIERAAPAYAPAGGPPMLTGRGAGERESATVTEREVSTLVPLGRTEEIVATLASMARPLNTPSWESRRAVGAERAAGDERAETSTESDLEQQKAMVLEVLEQYARAYERLDVQAVKAVFPTQDVRRLQNAFKGLDAQRVHFTSCGVVSMTGQAANARCQGDMTFHPRIGSRKREPGVKWNFDLSLHEDGWRIVNATILQ